MSNVAIFSWEKVESAQQRNLYIATEYDRLDIYPHAAHRATVVLCRHLKGLLPINADGRTCLSQSREHQEKAACSEVLDLSCSQHVLFGLEIHKSFDCFSLPDMSFQSDSFRAIPPPGFVIYISTIVWSPDFEERGNRFYPAWPHLSAPEIKENIQPLSKKFTSATCVIFTHISFSKHYLFSPVSNTTEPLLFSQGGGGRPWRNYFLVCCEHRVMFFQESSFNIEEMKIFFLFVFDQCKINNSMIFLFGDHNKNIHLNIMNDFINSGAIHSHILS